MAAGLGKAFIEIHADTRPFNKQLEALIKAAVEAMEKAMRGKASNFGQQMGESVSQGIRQQAPRIKATVEDTLSKVRPRIDVDVDVDRDSLRRTSRGVQGFFARAGRNLFEGVKVLGESIQEVVANLANIPAKSPLATLLTLLAFVLVPALSGALIGLSAVLANLLGFLGFIPAALATIIGLIAPIIVAFQGFGDAIDAVFSKDPKKIKEALSGLTPAAREVVGIIRQFVPAFEAIRKVAQEALFKPIAQVLGPTLKRLLPLLQSGFQRVAGVVGSLFAQFLSVMEQPAFRNFLTKLFPAIERMVQTLGPPIIAIFNSMIALAEAALPTFEQLIANFGGFLQDVADGFTRSIEDGSFKKFLDDAITAFGLLWDLGKAFFDLLRTIFSETEVEGNELVRIFTDLIKDLTAFFKSPEGKKFLDDLMNTAMAFFLLIRDWIPVLGAALNVINKIVGALLVGVQAADEIVRLLRQAQGMSSGRGAQLGTIVGGIKYPKFAEGDIVDRPTFGLFGERGPEAIIPLSQPKRAGEIMRQAGLGGIGPVTVIAQFGTQTITAMASQVVEEKFDEQARILSYGPRGN